MSLNIRYLEKTFGKSDLVRYFFSKLFVSWVMQIDRVMYHDYTLVVVVS